MYPSVGDESLKALFFILLVMLSGQASAAGSVSLSGTISGASSSAISSARSDTSGPDWAAVTMFLIFVALTLGITVWSSRRTRTAADFYSASGSITGFQNGLAIAGDYMSAASFLGISGLVYLSGFDRKGNGKG